MARPHAVCEVELLTKGPVQPADRNLATRKIRALCELGHEPVLSAVVKLHIRNHSTNSLSAMAEASMDLNGVPVRAHASANTLHEAIEDLDERLTRRLRRHRKRLENRRHASEPEPQRAHPGYAFIADDEREVVRHKTLATVPMSAEEAVDEMELLDHGFYLYFDADHDIDRVVYHDDDGRILVVPAVDGEDLPGDTRPPIYPARIVLNHLPLRDAVTLLDESDEPFVFFADPDSLHSQVLYRRFDGHYGLIHQSVNPSSEPISNQIRVVGLCGGIGAGKSTVAALLGKRGATVLDVDEIGHLVLLEDDVCQAVVAEFGDGVLNASGAIDRRALATEVFAHEGRRNALEAISHPAINQELDRRLSDLAAVADTTTDSAPHLVVLDMAVLVESDLGQLPEGRGYTQVVVVEADRQVRINRLSSRGMTAEDASTRMAAQASDAERRAVADHVLVNNADEATLASAVDQLFRQLMD